MSVPVSSLRRTVIAGTLLVLVTGCAGVLTSEDATHVAAAPSYHVGDRWVYRAQEGFMRPTVWEETHEVLSAGTNGITIRVVQRGPSVDNTRTEVLAAPGHVRVGALFDEETRRFEQELLRYDFPLAPGKSWNQWVRNFNESTQRSGNVNRYVRVGGWRRITTPAGTFDAIELQVVMRLDDEEFWRERTVCTYRLWYAPAVKATVREEREAEYSEKSGKFDTPPIRSQHALLELVSFTPGGR